MKPDVKRHMVLLLESDDPNIRAEAAEWLAEAGDESVIPCLVMGLRDESKGVREVSSRSLQQIATPAVAGAVVPLLAEGDFVLRNLAAKILIKMGSVSIRPLMPLLRHTSKDVRKSAVDILGEIGSPESQYQLLNLLHDEDLNVLVSVVEAIGNIGCVDAVEPLCKLYDVTPSARLTIADALGKISDVTASEFLLGKFVQAFFHRPADQVLFVTLLEALAKVGNLDASHALMLVMDDIDASVRPMLIHAIVSITDRHNLPVRFPAETRNDLLAALHHDAMDVVASAAKALMQFEGDDITQAFICLLGMEEDLDLLLFSHLPLRRNVPGFIIDLLSTGAIRQKAQPILLFGKLVSLSATGDRTNEPRSVPPGAFEVLAREFEAADLETQTLLADLLFQLDVGRALELFGAMAGAPDPWFKLHLLELFTNVQDIRAGECMRKFLDDEDEMVRDAAGSLLLSKSVPPASPMNRPFVSEGDELL